MRVERLAIPEICVLTPRVFADERGFFFESFNARVFHDLLGSEAVFVQDNHSQSVRGVLRGLHYQLPPHAQGKLIRVIRGEIFDVAVDIRPSSPTYGRWVSRALSAENKSQMWIPAGFAHGFLTLSDEAEVLYKATAFYEPSSERSIAWNDPTLGIEWPALVVDYSLSPKDAAAAAFSEVMNSAQ